MLPLLEITWSMKTVYMVCAAAGGTLLVIQTLLLLFGIGDFDGDADFDGDVGDGSFSVLSVRALISFFTFFGLAGWWGSTAGLSEQATIGLALAAGIALMFAVAWLLHLQSKLDSQGNLDPKNAVGESAQVYLRIPGENQGFGKITVKIQGRTAEYAAFTLGSELPTGAQVRVVRMTTPGSFEVVSLTEE